MVSRKASIYFVFTVGAFFVVLALAIGFSWSLIFNYIQREKLELTPSSETFNLWLKTPIPMYLEIYLFNWTNADQFLENKKIKPEFEEVGPFVFQEVHERVNLVWDNNHSVTYNQTRKWIFVPEKSMNLSVPVTNLNVVASVVTKMALNYKYVLKLLVEFLTLFYKEKLLITRPAGEWLFSGIEDKLLDFIKQFLPVPYDKFGWFYGRNMSSSFDGIFNIDTGEVRISNIGKINQWNNEYKTKFFKGECGLVNGTSSELFSPLNSFQNSISIFISDFCSFMTLNYSGVQAIKGVSGYKYVGDESVFDNGTQYPRSKCFCTGICSPSGVRNVTSCRQAPLFISFPHFYLADKSYRDAIVGMRPNKSEHEFYVTVDPLTGIPLEVKAQLQLNIFLQPIKQFSMFAEVPEIYIPTIWFRQKAIITSELVSKSEKLKNFEKLGISLSWSLGVAGVLIILLRILFLKLHSKNSELELLIPETKNEQEAPEEGTEKER